MFQAGVVAGRSERNSSIMGGIFHPRSYAQPIFAASGTPVFNTEEIW